MGDIRPDYERGNVRLYCADCLDVFKTTFIYADSVITDPPYADETHDGARTHKNHRYSESTDFAKLVSFESITYPQLAKVFEWLSAKASRWLISTVDWRHIHKLESITPMGWKFIRHGIWVKPNGAPQFTGDRPATGWEAVAILHRANQRCRWNGGGHHAVWTVPKVQGDHPTVKPVDLLLEWVRLFSDPGETILDPFMGSGTTGVAAVKLGRGFVGIERERKYFDVAVRRIEEAFEDTCLLDYAQAQQQGELVGDANA